MPSLRDPHCGNLVNPQRALRTRLMGVEHVFCSEACLRHYRYDHS